jgi:hypothetical protein
MKAKSTEQPWDHDSAPCELKPQRRERAGGVAMMLNDLGPDESGSHDGPEVFRYPNVSNRRPARSPNRGVIRPTEAS